MMGDELKRFVKRRSFDLLLFGWVSATRKHLPAVSIEQSVITFYAYYNLDEGEFPSVKSMITSYKRMDEEFREFLKK